MINLSGLYKVHRLGNTGLASILGKTVELSAALVNADEHTRSVHILRKLLQKLKLDTVANVHDLPDEVYAYFDAVDKMNVTDLEKHASSVLSDRLGVKKKNVPLRELVKKAEELGTINIAPHTAPKPINPVRKNVGVDKVIDCTKRGQKKTKSAKQCRDVQKSLPKINTIYRNGDGCRSPRKGPKLGGGKEGTVYKMVCGKRNRGKFVMKVYDDIYREVFVDEVMYHQTAAKLGIAPAILDAYVSPGKGMIVMQEVEGARTLREYMLSKKTDAEIVDTARQIARLVDRLHLAGIYHGDLHDENVMVDRHGRVWLIDFGRAGALDTRPDRVQKNLRQVEHDYEVLLSRKNLGNLFRYTLNKYVPKIVNEFWDEANRILDEVRIRGEIPYFSSSIYRFHGNM